MVKLSVASLRTGGKHPAEMATQAIMGTPVKMLEKTGEWVRVQTPDGYIAYIPSTSIVKKSEKELAAWRSSKRVIVTEKFSTLMAEPDAEADVVSDLVLGNILEYRSSAMVGRKLEVIQAGGLSVVDMQALALARRYEIIYIDYLQLIAPDDRRRSDVEQVTQISKDLHVMAQTTGITVCALSQLSRPQKGGENEKAPGLHSLRQSGQIEQDADGVLLLYKEEPNNPRSRRCLKIAKNKDGEAGGIVYLVFDGAHQRFKASVVDKPVRREPEYK